MTSEKLVPLQTNNKKQDGTDNKQFEREAQQ